MRPHERWIWTELIGFDNREPDQGVARYLDAAGFTPKAISLLLTTPDFILSHADIQKESDLPPDYCARDGHEFNRQRKRQVWTNYQLRCLIENLHKRGIECYVSVFTRFYGDRFHHEWVSDHREVFQVWRSRGPVSAINSLSRFKDGSYYEDYFGKQLVAVLRDYDFDGWHGADGYGPLNGPIYEVSFSDDMVAQFVEGRQLSLPDFVVQECDHDVPRLEARAAWIWRKRRREWIEFWAERWACFWRNMVGRLHAAGKKAVINSAWGRDPFESLYRYGIDYQKIVETGVDGIVVETVAAGLGMDPRTDGPEWHYHFLSMLMLLKAYVPEANLIFLHNVHDVVEQWDALHHMPALLEREIYSLSNVFHINSWGKLKPCADGFLVCLGDGLSGAEWDWLRERWALAFEATPRRTWGATVVWSDAAFRNQLDDFIRTRTWPTQMLLLRLMEKGAPIQSVVHIADLERSVGPLVALNLHLFPEQERARLFQYSNGPVIAIGRRPPDPMRYVWEFGDVYPPDTLWCGSWGGSGQFVAQVQRNGQEVVPADVLDIPDPPGYWENLRCRKVSESFLNACARAILHAAGCFKVLSESEAVTVMMDELEDGALRLAIKSKVPVYARPQIDLGKPIASVEVLTSFPSVAVHPEGTKFSVRVPGKGIVVLRVRLEPASSVPA